METNRELKILILYASYGDGHLQVSKALQQCFCERGIKHVSLVDLYKSTHPLVDAITRYAYLMSCSFCPQLYGWSYYLTENMQHNRIPAKLLNSFGAGTLKEIIREEKPDAIINTFPMPGLPGVCRKAGIYVPIFTVLTDFALHSRWIHRDIDHFFVASEELKAAVINKGIPAECVTASGIPLRKAFYQPYDKNRIYLRFGLDPSKKIVLIMAGAYGVLRNLSKICQALLYLEDVQVLVVCGKNRSLKERLEADLAGEPKVNVLGFIENIQELMVISSCMITKAGGITLSEALSLELPVVVFRPLPGQERENAFFFTKKGAALIAGQIEELVRNVEVVLYESQHLSQMKRSICELQKKNSTETIVSDILNKVGTRNK